jgi:hypothetical protein
MFEHTKPIITEAEGAASVGAQLPDVLKIFSRHDTTSGILGIP